MKKKFLSAFLALAMVCTIFPSLTIGAKAAYATEWYTAPGTNDGSSEATPYLLHNTADLEGLVMYANHEDPLNFEGKYIKLADDFDETGTLTMPIGLDDSHPFKGTFDGNGKTVTLAIDSTNAYAGLFGYLADGTVKNVKTEGTVTISFGNAKNYAGGVVGYSSNGHIEGCSSSASVTASKASGMMNVGNYAGGVVGYSENGYIEDCGSSATVTASDASGMLYVSNYAGGLVGGLGSTSYAAVTNSYAASVNVTASGSTGSNCAGGLVGSDNNQTILNCYASGTATASNATDSYAGNYAGGLVGYKAFGSTINCYADVEVIASGTNGEKAQGGVVGYSNVNLYEYTNTFYPEKEGLNGVGAAYTEEQYQPVSLSKTVMKAYYGREGALVDLLNAYVEENSTGENELCSWITNGRICPIFSYQGTEVEVSARLDRLETIPEDAVLSNNCVAIPGIRVERTENGKAYILRNDDDKALALDPVTRQLVPAVEDKDATLWYYNGGLFALVNANRACRGGFFRSPRFVKYYLAATAYGTAYCRLTFSPAVVLYKTRVVTDDVVSLDCTPSPYFMGALKKFGYNFTITAPEGAKVSYKAALVEGFGRYFAMAYKPAFVYITVAFGEGKDAIITNWQAKLTRTCYEMSIVE